MGAEKKKPRSNTRKQISACQKKKVDAIVAEADRAENPPKDKPKSDSAPMTPEVSPSPAGD